LFTEEDDRSGAAATVIFTQGLWKRRYAGNPAIVGKTILLDAVPYTVIGVLPAWFDYPDTRVQLWQTVNHEVSTADMHNRGNHRSAQRMASASRGPTANWMASSNATISNFPTN
jgi:hypothetical protein